MTEPEIPLPAFPPGAPDNYQDFLTPAQVRAYGDARAEAERARVVAWLRDEGTEPPPSWDEQGLLRWHLADQIEHGDHTRT